MYIRLAWLIGNTKLHFLLWKSYIANNQIDREKVVVFGLNLSAIMILLFELIRWWDQITFQVVQKILCSIIMVHQILTNLTIWCYLNFYDCVKKLFDDVIGLKLKNTSTVVNIGELFIQHNCVHWANFMSQKYSIYQKIYKIWSVKLLVLEYCDKML